MRLAVALLLALLLAGCLQPSPTPAPPTRPTCEAQEGTLCVQGQACQGRIVLSRDSTPARFCCVGKCVVPGTPGAATPTAEATATPEVRLPTLPGLPLGTPTPQATPETTVTPEDAPTLLPLATPQATPGATPGPFRCTDTDGGFATRVAGRVTVDGQVYEDACTGPARIREYVCTPGGAAAGEIECPAGHVCREGACAPFFAPTQTATPTPSPTPVTAAPTPTPAPADFYVATKGNDAWSGKLASPNAAGTDGPLATLERARDAVRAARKADPTRAYTVLVRGGSYPLRDTLVFTPDDSGSAGAPVTYAAYPSERPVISGGRPVSGWTRHSDKLWKASVPEVAQGKLYFQQLWVNGKRAQRARTPNEGRLLTEGLLVPWPPPNENDPEARIGFTFKASDAPAWEQAKAGLPDVNVVLIQGWSTSINWPASIDLGQRTVRFTAPTASIIGYSWGPQVPYALEGFLGALDRPGEWHLERATGTLYYWPLPGEDMATASVVYPLLNHILLLNPPGSSGRLEHLRFVGLSFQHSEWFTSNRNGGAETWHWTPRAAIEGRQVGDIHFKQCEVAHAGEYAIWLTGSARDNSIVECDLHDLGAGGIKLGGSPLEGGRDQGVFTRRNVIENNWIRDIGRIYTSSEGIYIGYASQNRARHNELSGLSFMGIHVGQDFGYGGLFGDLGHHSNLIEYNHVHDIRTDHIELAGIYTLGVSPGTAIRNNLIHDASSSRPSPDQPGLYNDETSSEILMENNIVHRTPTGYYLHYGRDNLLRNNIIAPADFRPVRGGRFEPHDSFEITRNIFHLDKPHVLDLRDVKHYLFHRNLYWNTQPGSPLDFAGLTFAEWQARGEDGGSLVSDPRFVAPAQGDYRLQPDSPAFQLGFQPIDASQIGRYGPRWGLPDKATQPYLPANPAPTAVQGIAGAVQVASGRTHACALIKDGTVKCWGQNTYGQLGDGTTTSSASPVTVTGISGAVHIAAGGWHTCALLAGGAARCWGQNTNGQLGNGAPGGQRKSPLPVAVESVTTATQLSAGLEHTCALLADGTVKCWGNNLKGQLGDGTTTSSALPVTVTGISDAVQVAAGGLHACALRSGNALACWGWNGWEQLGDGTNQDRLVPSAVTGVPGVTRVSTGKIHTCAALADGTVKCWGGNGEGQLGDGTHIGGQPRTVKDATGISQVAAGEAHSCALRADQRVACWGSNWFGQLGDGSATDRFTAGLIPGLSAVQLSAGNFNTCALLADGTVSCWGQRLPR